MNITLPRALVVLLALVFVLAGCASDTGSQWTFAPTTSEPGEPTESAEPAESEEPVESAEPEATAEPEQSAAPPAGGEPRVIDLQADSALRFTDASGQPLPEIAVTPGETLVFRIDNTAGFAHNFWIGEDSQLSVPAGTTDVGIPDWATGVQEVEWVVPENAADLKFACTVPGHYYTMQGGFSLAETSVEPEASAEPAEPAEPEAPAEPEQPAEPAEPIEPEQPAVPPAAGEPRVIELEADAAIRFLQEGVQIQNIDVTPGETVVFRVANSAGFPHNFYIGADEDLAVMAGTTDVGIPDWNTGVQELEWVVPEDVSDIRFACTVPGHYFTMQGDFTVSP